MKRILREEKTISEILNVIKAIKLKSALSENYCNYFGKYNSSDAKNAVWIGDNTIVFVVEEEYINRVFFFTRDVDELSDLFRYIPEGCVLDYIGKSMPEELYNTFSNAGLIKHAEYARITLSVPYETDKGDLAYKELLKKLYKPDVGAPAALEDLTSIREIMFERFDPINSEIPTKEELMEDIKNQTVWIYKHNDRIVTMYIFRIYGKKRYGVMTYNLLSADYLDSLIENAHKEAEITHTIKWHYGWFDVENNKIIRTLKKKGIYEPDGTRNYVFVKKEVN